MKATWKSLSVILLFLFFALPATASAFTIFGWTFDLFGSSLDDGLVGHWTFDGKNLISNVADSSGLGKNGNLILGASGNIATTTEPGVLGQALVFDGTNDYVSVSSPSLPTGDFTLSAWANVRVFSPAPTILMIADGSGGNEIWFGFNSSTRAPGFNLNDAAAVYGSTGIATSTWNHVVMRRSGSDVRIFLNNTDIGSATNGGTLNFSSCALLIGVDADQTCVGVLGNYMPGKLDDVRIYNRALSAEEVKRLYSLGSSAVKAGTAPSGGTLGAGGTSGLVGHWTFDGKHMTSNVADASGNGNNGMLLGQTSTTTTFGVSGQALQFDGTNDYVTIPNISGMTRATVSAWIKTVRDPVAAGMQIVLRDNDAAHRVWQLRVSGVGKLDVIFFNTSHAVGSVTSLVSVNDGKWHHVLGTWDGTTVRAYVDGVESGTPDSFTGTLSTDNLAIGIGYGGPSPYIASNYFQGEIDDVRIYNRALSAEEVKRLYSLGSSAVKAGTAPSGGTLGAGGTSGLVGHWTFDGKHMTSNVADASGNGNNGMLLGQTSTTTTFGVLGQALSFDGAGDYVNLGDSYDMGTNDMTVAFWIKTTDTDFSIVSKSLYSGVPNRWAVGVNEGSGLFSIFEGSGMASPAPVAGVTDGNWHHFVAVFDRDGNLSQYLDGVYKNSANISGQSAYNMQSSFYTFIGNYNNVDGQTPHPTALRFSGALDDVRIYNRVLSAEEIKRLYTAGR